jgi:hypothetical protein
MAAFDENVRGILRRRHRELLHQIAALRGQLDPKEVELAEVKQLMAVLDMREDDPPWTATGVAPPHGVMQAEGVAAGVASVKGVGIGLLGIAGEMLTAPSEHTQRFIRMTIKDLVRQALSDNFRDGATPTQLREFIRDAYGREIDPDSLRPQLFRMREEGLINQIQGVGNLRGKWVLVLHGGQKPNANDESSFLMRARELAWREEPDRDGSGEPASDIGTPVKRKSDDFLE